MIRILSAQRLFEHLKRTCMEAQRNAGGNCSAYAFGPDMPPLRCSRVLTLAELRRRKRDFLQLASKSLNKPTRDGVKKLFIECLQEASEG